MGVHESQSLLWERMVGLSRPFAAYLLPIMREAFPQVWCRACNARPRPPTAHRAPLPPAAPHARAQLPGDKGPEDLYAALNIIKVPSMIRVEADEITYPLHIIIR